MRKLTPKEVAADHAIPLGVDLKNLPSYYNYIPLGVDLNLPSYAYVHITVRLIHVLYISYMFRGPYGRLAVELNMSPS